MINLLLMLCLNCFFIHARYIEYKYTKDISHCDMGIMYESLFYHPLVYSDDFVIVDYILCKNNLYNDEIGSIMFIPRDHTLNGNSFSFHPDHHFIDDIHEWVVAYVQCGIYIEGVYDEVSCDHFGYGKVHRLITKIKYIIYSPTPIREIMNTMNVNVIFSDLFDKLNEDREYFSMSYTDITVQEEPYPIMATLDWSYIIQKYIYEFIVPLLTTILTLLTAIIIYVVARWFYNEEDCIICMNAIGFSYKSTLPCGHMAHSACILRWFEEQKRCPLCRYDCKYAYVSNSIIRVTLRRVSMNSLLTYDMMFGRNKYMVIVPHTSLITLYNEDLLILIDGKIPFFFKVFGWLDNDISDYIVVVISSILFFSINCKILTMFIYDEWVSLMIMFYIIILVATSHYIIMKSWKSYVIKYLYDIAKIVIVKDKVIPKYDN